MTTELTLAEQFLLLALDDHSGKPLTDSTHLHAALAGAVLVDLARDGALEIAEHDTDVRRGRLRSTGRATPADPLVGEILDRAHGKKPQAAVSAVSIGAWTDRAGRLKDAMLRDLAERGMLREEQGRVLGLFPTTRWPAGQPGPEAEALARVRAAMTAPETADGRTASLVVILGAAELLHKVLPEIPKRVLKERSTQLAERDWAGAAVGRAVEEAVVAAILPAVMASTVAAGTAGAAGG